MLHRCRFLLALVALLPLAGCAQLWAAKGETSARAKMADAYANWVCLFGDINPEDVIDIDPPSKLRPCCAFGSGLEVSIGTMPLRGFSLDNLRSVDGLGRHNYDKGLVSLGGSDGAMISNERNGLLSTCYAGFIDSAHVRDYADWMLFLTGWVARRVETGGELTLPSEAGVRRVVMQPLPESVIRTEHQGSVPRAR